MFAVDEKNKWIKDFCFVLFCFLPSKYFEKILSIFFGPFDPYSPSLSLYLVLMLELTHFISDYFSDVRLWYPWENSVAFIVLYCFYA